MDNILVYLNTRINIYNTVSDFFYREPIKELHDTIKTIAPVIKEFATQSNINIDSGYDEFMSYKWTENSEDELAKEFASIFLVSDVNNRISPIVPHESVYLSRGGLVMQEERDKVLEKFYKAGFKKQKGFTEPEDHIKAELDFIAGMTLKLVTLLDEEKTSEAIENIQSQIIFTNEHLSRWFARVCNDITARSRSSYFKGLSQLIAGYVTADIILFNSLAESINTKQVS